MPKEALRNPTAADLKFQALFEAASAGNYLQDAEAGDNKEEVDKFVFAVQECLVKDLFDLSEENLQRILTIAEHNEESEIWQGMILARIEGKFPGARLEHDSGLKWEVVYSDGASEVRRPIADVLAECRE